MLLGEDILPMATVACNTIVTEITYGPIPQLLTYDHSNNLVKTIDLLKSDVCICKELK